MEMLTSILTNTFDFLITYQWYLFGLVLLFGAFRHRIYAHYRKYRRRLDEYEYAAKYHKNSDLGKQRLDAVAAAREKMQRELEAKAAEAERIRLEKKAEEKLLREARLQDDKNAPTSSKSSLRAEHFPLMGHSSGSCYRPPKKSCCKKGGGCG